MRLEEVDLDSIKFWLQIHGLQRDQMLVENAHKIRAIMGEMVELDESMGVVGGFESYLRVRIKLKGV